MRDDILLYLWLIILSFISGIIGIINRHEFRKKGSLKDRLYLIICGGISSIFIGYVTFEITFFYFNSQRLSIAISAFCAWSGTKVLLELEDRLLDFIQNYKREDNK